MGTSNQQVLERRLGLGTVDEQELAFILGNIFQRAQYTTEDRVDYPDADQPLISLLYDRKKGGLTGIVPGRDLTEHVIAQIEHEVANKLLVPAETMVHRMTLFAHLPTEGYWRYNDKLVIRPVPDEAPRPFFLLAPHPLILEVKFSGATDGFIRNFRAQREPRQFALFLSLLVPGIKVPSLGHRHSWVVETKPPSDGSHPQSNPDFQSVLAQDLYFIPNFSGFADELSEQGQLSVIELVPSLPGGVRVDQVLVLPADITKYFDTFMTEDRRKILRASYWLHHAQEVWDLSKSANYQAMIQAVEALIDVPKGEPQCPQCNRSVGKGPTKRFIDFVDHFAPKDDGAEEPERKLLYSTRSYLTHGNGLLYADEETGIGWHGPKPVYERQLADRTHDICRRAVTGWLRSQA